jgi:phage shock protein A
VKRFVYWLIGDTAGRILVGVWGWLWGIPIESGGKVAVAVAEESLQSMQESVQKLAKAVADQQGAYKRAKAKYEAKVAEVQVLGEQARTAQQQGKESLARLAMTRLIQSEQILPQLERMVQQAEQAVNLSTEKLSRERLKLESFKIEMQNIKDIAEVNAALAAIARVNQEFDIGSAKRQFETAKNAVENRNRREHALAELSENPTEKLSAELDQITLDAEVTKRLQAFYLSAKPSISEVD